MYTNIPRRMQKRVYCFAGGKENPDWYCMEYKISAFAIGFDKESKKLYCNFVCDNTAHLGAFIVLSLEQMIVLPFKHRLYFSQKKAKKRQSLNYNRRADNG